MIKDFFPQRPDSKPMIYAYEDSNPMYEGLLKVGYTAIDVEKRVAQQYPIVRPGAKPYHIVFAESAMYSDGSTFIDRDMHRNLRKKRYKNSDGEWFKCTVDELKAAYIAVKHGIQNEENRTHNFAMRPEQEEAVKLRQKTSGYIAPTGILLYLMNTISVHGEKMPKNCLKMKMTTNMIL